MNTKTPAIHGLRDFCRKLPRLLVKQACWTFILAMVDEMEAAQQAITVAYDESVGVWVEQIRAWFEVNPEAIEVRQLQAQLDWPLVQVWLGLLLGGFQLEPGDGEFYARPIWVEH